MKYSTTTLTKVIRNLKTRISYWKRQGIDAIKVCISSGNKKLGRIMNVSLAPIITCANCKECKRLCYDIKACLQYFNILDARARNTALVQLGEAGRAKYFGAIRKAISRRRTNKYFRWHVSGDIPDIAYLAEMIAIARENPDFIFWTYTKNYFCVNAYVERNGGSKEAAIPENLIIMFSEWDGMPMINPYSFPVFSCRLKDGNKNRTAESFETMYKCPGNCDLCKAARRGCIGGEDTFVDEH